MQSADEAKGPEAVNPAGGGARGPAAMTQEQVDTLIAGGPEARKLRKRLLPDDRGPAAEEPAGPAEAKTSPVPVSRRELDGLRKPGGGRGLRKRIQEATRPAGVPGYAETKARPAEVPPHLRRK